MRQLLLDFGVNLAEVTEKTMRPVGVVLCGIAFAALCAHVSIPYFLFEK